MNQVELQALQGKSVALVSTVPYFLVNQLATHIRSLRRLGMEVTVVTSRGRGVEIFSDDPGIHVVNIEIPRRIRPFDDLRALIKLFGLFRGNRFSLVHSTTPKAGLLCAVAGRLAGVPIRLHTFTGQVWAVKSGFMRKFLQSLDRLILHLNTHCYADSPSQRQFMVDSGVATADAISVYGPGSLAGVDLERFSPERFSEKEKKQLIRELGLKNDPLILSFIGRITEEKGVRELLAAFRQLRDRHASVALLMLGPVDDESGRLIQHAFGEVSGVHWQGYVQDPERYLAITDVLCLPSYREGFGTVVVEAAAMAVPSIGTQISGLVDAIENGITGLLVPVRDVDALAESIESLIRNQALLQRMKAAARERCLREFDSRIINENMAKEYAKWLSVKTGTIDG